MENRNNTVASPSRGAVTLWGVAASLVFLINGLPETGLAPHYPELATGLHIGLATLGLVLTGFPIGQILGALAAVPVCRRLGSRWTILVGGIGFVMCVGVAPLAPSPWMLWTALAAAAFCNGVLDIGQGFTGTEHREVLHRLDPDAPSSNQFFEIMFYVGSLIGAGSASLAFALHWSPFMHLSLLAIAAVAVLIPASQFLPLAPERDAAGEAPDDEPPEQPRPLRRGRFVALLVIRFASFAPLGVAFAWSATYLLSQGCPPVWSVSGLVAYLVAGAGSQAVVGWLGQRLDPQTITRLGSVIAGVGAVMIVAPLPLVATVVGWGLLGTGVAPIGPEARAASARLGRGTGKYWAMSLFQNTGYLAGVVCQPLIGSVAGFLALKVGNALGLRGAMGLLLVFVAAILVCSFALPGRASSDAPART